MMKHISFFLLSWLLLYGHLTHAQFSVLFVDDSDDTFGNAELFHAALDSIGYPATYYNAVDSADSPTDLYMQQFDLVIWHTSTMGLDLQLWNGLDEDNARLKAYLDGGGKLWLVGLDFLFDRYGVAPVSFQNGDFVFDYLGLQSYDLQSYGDDGSTGLPLVSPDTAQPIPGLPTLTWTFPTLWWVDGVSLRQGAVPVYRMGNATYVFADSVTGCWYDNGTSQALTYLFDLALVSDFELLKTAILPVMNFFAGPKTSLSPSTQSALRATVYPNPAAGPFTLHLELQNRSAVSISLWNLNGQKVQDMLTDTFPVGVHKLNLLYEERIPAGLYQLRIMDSSSQVSMPIILHPQK